MAGTYTPTGTYSNLTRLELEQLRRGDYTAGGKALTVGDSGLSPEGILGPGNVNAEPFTSAPAVAMSEIVSFDPPAQPGLLLWNDTTVALGTGTLYGNISNSRSDSVSWHGPTLIHTHPVFSEWYTGYFNDANNFQGAATGFVTAGVQAGDLLILLSVGTLSGSVHTVTSVTDESNLDVAGTGADLLSGYEFLIVRPSAIQLFAVPGSGPTGQEQSFMMVSPLPMVTIPGPAVAPIHDVVGPSVDQINTVRVKNIVRPSFGLDSSVDRADAIYPSPGPGSAAGALGYRVVLYPDDGTGTGPDLAAPIASLNPVIDPAIPVGDQRMTIDYSAGLVRFSCAPATGGAIKPSAGCVNATTGRLNLYAVFWAHVPVSAGFARPFLRSHPNLPFSGTITVTRDYDLYLIQTGASARDINLPASNSVRGRVFTFKDIGGALATNAATFVRNGSDTIEGLAANFVWEAPGATLRMFATGSGWIFI